MVLAKLVLLLVLGLVVRGQEEGQEEAGEGRQLGALLTSPWVQLMIGQVVQGLRAREGR